MAKTKVNDAQLLEALTKVFQIYGYEGASLSLISQATGLQRASLYHRFPQGKEQMVEAVLEHVDQRFETYLLAPLSMSHAPAARVRDMAKRIGEFYLGGQRSCLLDTLSLGKESGEFHTHIKQSFTAWLNALEGIARVAGFSTAQARQRSEQALISIEGALVLARAIGNTKPFKQALKALPALLTGV